MTVYLRSNMWYMNFTVEGHRVNKSTGVPKNTNKRDRGKATAIVAESKEMDRIKEELGNGISPDFDMTLAQGIERIYEERWMQSKDGENAYKRAYRVLDIIGNLPLAEINGEQVAKLAKTLRKKGMKPGTINRHFASLKTIMRTALREWEVIQRVPHFRMEKEAKGRIRVITPGELDAVVQYFENRNIPEFGDLAQVLIDTGMRLSECLGLKYSDVDFGQNLIHVWENKTDQPRSLPMTNKVKRVLLHRKGVNHPDEEQFFPMTRYQAEHYWQKMRKAIGLDEDRQFVWHALRHTCASRLVQKGADLYVVKEMLGHSTIKVTERYAHLAPANLKEAIQLLEED